MAKQIFMILASGKIFNCLAGYYAILEHPKPQGGVAQAIIILLKDSYAICRDEVFRHTLHCKPLQLGLYEDATLLSIVSAEQNRICHPTSSIRFLPFLAKKDSKNTPNNHGLETQKQTTFDLINQKISATFLECQIDQCSNLLISN